MDGLIRDGRFGFRQIGVDRRPLEGFSQGHDKALSLSAGARGAVKLASMPIHPSKFKHVKRGPKVRRLAQLQASRRRRLIVPIPIALFNLSPRQTIDADTGASRNSMPSSVCRSLSA